MVVAILNQSEFEVFESREQVPADALIFEGPEDIAKLMTKKSMDSLRDKLLNMRGASSPTPEDASINLWIALTKDFVNKPKIRNLKIPQVDKMGNRKFRRMRNEFLYLNFHPSEKNSFNKIKLVESLQPQAKEIIYILIEDGRRTFTHDQLVDIVQQNLERLGTKQSPWKLFTWYCTKFYYPRGILKQITLLDVIRNPKYQNPTTY